MITELAESRSESRTFSYWPFSVDQFEPSTTPDPGIHREFDHVPCPVVGEFDPDLSFGPAEFERAFYPRFWELMT